MEHCRSSLYGDADIVFIQEVCHRPSQETPHQMDGDVRSRTDKGTGIVLRQQDSCQIRQLWYLYSLYLGERDEGVFVEVGANDGLTVSNTWGLAERGWRGLMIEPISEIAQLCRSNHQRHANVSVLECAVGANRQLERDDERGWSPDNSQRGSARRVRGSRVGIGAPYGRQGRGSHEDIGRDSRVTGGSRGLRRTRC